MHPSAPFAEFVSFFMRFYRWLVRKLCEILGNYCWLVRNWCEIIDNYSWLVSKLREFLENYGWLVRQGRQFLENWLHVVPRGPSWPLVAPRGPTWPLVAPRGPSWPLAPSSPPVVVALHWIHSRHHHALAINQWDRMRVSPVNRQGGQHAFVWICGARRVIARRVIP